MSSAPPSTRKRLTLLNIYAICVASLISALLPSSAYLVAAAPAVPPSADSALASPANENATDRPPTAEQIGLWIDHLSHDAYTVRRDAADRLLAAGAAARLPLAELTDGPDPETRAAARRLVALIDRNEFNRRLEAFAADRDGLAGLTLPGWEAFQEFAGGDETARALFVDMQRHERPLLERVFGSEAAPAAGFWDDRLLRLLQWQVTAQNQNPAPPLGSCATMLFLACAPEGQVSDAAARYIFQLVQRPPMREAIQSGEHQDVIRRLTVSWILDCPIEGEQILQMRLNLASVLLLDEAVPLALDVAHGNPEYITVQPSTRAMAILIVGQFGDVQDIDRLEPLLEDTSIFMQTRANLDPNGQAILVNVQVRDVALAAMIHLTDQEASDYGFVSLRRHPQRLFNLATLYMENDEARKKAAEKWRAWRANHQQLPAMPNRDPAARVRPRDTDPQSAS